MDTEVYYVYDMNDFNDYKELGKITSRQAMMHLWRYGYIMDG